MLTRQRQQQYIRNFIEGTPLPVDPALLSENYRTIFDYLIDVDIPNRRQQFCLLSFHDPSWKDIIDDVLSLEANYKRHYKSLAEIGPDLPEVEWFWENWIPKGYLSIFAATPGAGKSYVALDLCYRCINSLPAPDGQAFNASDKPVVIYVDGEKFLPILYARVNAWQMDMTRFFPFEAPDRSILDLSQSSFQDELIDMVEDLRPDLIVIDSLSRVNSRGENNIEDLRDVLDFMAQLPAHFKCATLLIHHLRKRSSAQVSLPITIHDIRGSGDLVAAGRSILSLDTFQVDSAGDPVGPRRLKIIKNNLSPKPKPMALTMVPLPNNPKYVAMEYGDASFYMPPAQTKTEECAEWLLDYLADGPKPFGEIQEAAEDQGYKTNVLLEARKNLVVQVIDTIGPKTKGNKWQLKPEFFDDTE